MDRREAIAASYYAQRGGGGVSGAQPVLHGSQGMSYQGNYGVGTTIGPPLPAETSSVVSPHSVNVGTPTVVPVGQAEPVNRKQGRARKYGPDGSVSLALSSASISPPASSSLWSMQRRGRGRPPGSGRKLRTVSPDELSLRGRMSVCRAICAPFEFVIWYWSSQTAKAGVGFTPHIITIAVGEGRFEILCLSGSLLLMDNTGSRNRIGDLSISLASPDGRVNGGVVGGLLIVTTPVWVVIGSFSWVNSKLKNKKRKVPIATDSSGPTIQPLNPTSTPPGQKLSAVPVGSWPDDLQPVDIDGVGDIDLMRS